MNESKHEGRSLPWFRVNNDVVDHPKVDALAERLNDEKAGWYIIRLWSWTMRYAARGRLAPGARLSVERACGWRGTAGDLWRALVDIGWIDVAADGTAEVHDWDEHQGAAVAKAEKDANRKRDDRIERKRRADGAGRSADAGADRRADAAGNGTERDGTEEEGPIAGASAPPQLELVADQPPKGRPPPKPPDPEAEFKRFAAALTPDERAVFEAYEQHMGVELGADWALRKFVTGKLKAHHASELCAAIKGHARDAWKRENNPSLRAILRDATVIAIAAKAGAA